MQQRNYDWIFIFAIVVVLAAFISTEIQALGADYNSLLAIVASIGGLLGNIAASRFEQSHREIKQGKFNPWLVGCVAGALLYVVLNATILVVAFVLVAQEEQLVQRNAAFVGDRNYFAQYVFLSSSAIAALFVAIISVVTGAALLSRSRKHLIATVVASLGYIGIALVMRGFAMYKGDISQFDVFKQIGWGEVMAGLLLNVSIVSIMLWLGIVLARGRSN